MDAMNPGRRAFLRAFLALPVAARFRPPVPAPAPFVLGGFSNARSWCFTTPGSNGIERGQWVAMRPDGTIYGLVDPQPWMMKRATFGGR
jgi:hypothetical protein